MAVETLKPTQVGSGSGSGWNVSTQLRGAEKEAIVIYGVTYLTTIAGNSLWTGFGLDPDYVAAPGSIDGLWERADIALCALHNAGPHRLDFPKGLAIFTQGLRWLGRNDSGNAIIVACTIEYELVRVSTPLLVAHAVARRRGAAG